MTTAALSIVFHALIAATLLFSARWGTPTSTALSPLRFTGTTFDVQTAYPKAVARQGNATTEASSPNPSQTAPDQSPTSEEKADSDESASSDETTAADESASSDETTAAAAESASSDETTASPKNTSSDDSSASQKNTSSDDSSASEKSASAEEHSRTESGVEADAGVPSGAAPSDPGSFGQKGLPPGVVDLTRAFIKTLPLAGKSDRRWLSLPEGPAGSITVRLELDDRGRVEDLVVLDDDPVPAHMKRLAEMNRRFLARGRFAIAHAPEAATQVFTIRAAVEQRPPTDVDSEGVHALGVRGAGRPTGAYFTYYSGRHVEFDVEGRPR